VLTADPAADATAVETSKRATSHRYRPYLDGLRAVAVYLVVAFHAGLGLVSGGFIGVDIFFVLSGFLVTGILIRDLASTGHVRWRMFYSRRVRRILPASLIALVVTALVYAIVASPLEMFDALGGFRAAFFYVGNWFFIHQATDYFAANVNGSPVLHFWSLAVEEQFYFVWPLLLGAIYLVAGRMRRRWWVLRGVVLALGVASAVQALHIGATNLDRAYYGTDTRAYQLLAGAALVLTPQLLHLGRRLRAAAGVVSALALAAILVLATSAITMSAITRGVWVALLAVVLIASLENATGGPAKGVLSSPGFTYLGRISYGIYLWHWPVIVIAMHGRSPSPLELFAIATPTATALAALSFHLIEHPIRMSRVLDRFRMPVIVVGFTTSILIGVVVAPAILNSQNTSLNALVAASKSDPGPKLLDWRVAAKDFVPLGFHDCLNQPVDVCTVVKGTGLKIVIVGDSIARMWIPAFTEIAQKDSMTFSVATYQGCPWQLGLQYNGAPAIQSACGERQKDWYRRVIPELHPDIIFLAQHGYDDATSQNRFNVPGIGRLTSDSPKFEPVLQSMSTHTLNSLHAPGRRIVILEPVPVPTADPVACLSRGGSVASCGFPASKGPSELERYFRGLNQTNPDITSVDLDRLACPHLPRCDAVVGNVIAWRDIAHLTVTYVKTLAPQLEAVLKQQRILPAG
jgi:peptidoglycan/LPS O-acetylase OafA/YrhL